MRILRTIGRLFWRFMVIFSFIVNLILVVVLLVLGLLIFDIKNNIAQPLVGGLHSSFVGLDNATIDWTIPVRDTIPVVMNVPLETDTTVILNAPVPLTVNALIDLPGINAYNVSARVELELPQGLALPVKLDLNVPIDQQLDVSLDVRAVIPLKETQLHDVAENLRLLFEPLARALYNLPGNFGEAGQLAGDVLAGRPPNLLADNAYSLNPWPGFSQTAGLNYDALLDEPVPPSNLPLNTGIVPVGGIPALDEQLRPDIYDRGGPAAVNAEAATSMEAQSVPSGYYNGGIGDIYVEAQQAASAQATETPTDTGGPTVQETPGPDLGIMPTPSG